MIFTGVADTHTTVWLLTANPMLSSSARNFISLAADRGAKIGVSSITLAEVLYLTEKGRLAHEIYDEVLRALADPEHVLREVPVTLQVVAHMREVARAHVPDLPDRIVTGTALALNVPVITCDAQISASGVPTVW